MKCRFEFDLFDYIDKVSIGNREWYAGSQLELLHAAFPKAKFIFETLGGGEWYALFKFKSKYFLLNGYFGSCGGCDSLDGATLESAVDYLKSVCGNAVKQNTLNQIKEYLNKTEDYGWQAVRLDIIKKIEKVN